MFAVPTFFIVIIVVLVIIIIIIIIIIISIIIIIIIKSFDYIINNIFIMYYTVKNYVSLNKTSLTHRAPSICLGTDINKCLVNNGGCSHYCKKWGSSYICTCPAGYEVDSSDKNCIGNKMTVFNNSFSIFGSRFVYFISSSCCISTLPADCLPLARFWLTGERFCMNRVRSFLSIRCILLGNSLEPGPYIAVHVV